MQICHDNFRKGASGGATNDNVFYLQAILDVERLVEIQMLDGREIRSDSTSRFDLREGFHRLVAICSSCKAMPKRLVMKPSPAQCVQRHEQDRKTRN